MSKLYLTEQGAILHKIGERLVATRDDQVIEDIPLIELDQVILMGNIRVTTPLLTQLLREGIDVVYLTRYGRYKGRLVGPESRFGQLRYVQIKRADDTTFSLAIAKQIVWGKLNNQQVLIRRHSRNSPSAEAARALKGIAALLKKVGRTKSVDTLRGYEGQGAALYFPAYGKLIRQDLGFKGRNRRPPTDPVNSLLSFGYTVLLNEIMGAVQLVGMDPYIGFFHAMKYGCPSLALDIEEEFRPIIVDTLVLDVVNHRHLTGKDFRRKDGAILLTDEGRRKFIEAYERRVATQITYHLTKERTTYRRCFELQARHLARCIQGKDKLYQPRRIR